MLPRLSFVSDGSVRGVVSCTRGWSATWKMLTGTQYSRQIVFDVFKNKVNLGGNVAGIGSRNVGSYCFELDNVSVVQLA